MIVFYAIDHKYHLCNLRSWFSYLPSITTTKNKLSRLIKFCQKPDVCEGLWLWTIWVNMMSDHISGHPSVQKTLNFFIDNCAHTISHITCSNFALVGNLFIAARRCFDNPSCRNHPDPVGIAATKCAPTFKVMAQRKPLTVICDDEAPVK